MKRQKPKCVVFAEVVLRSTEYLHSCIYLCLHICINTCDGLRGSDYKKAPSYSCLIYGINIIKGTVPLDGKYLQPHHIDNNQCIQNVEYIWAIVLETYLV